MSGYDAESAHVWRDVAGRQASLRTQTNVGSREQALSGHIACQDYPPQSPPVRSPSRLKHCEPAQQAISANALMALSRHRGIFVGCIAVTGVTHFVRGPGRARARQDVYEVGATESCVRPADAPLS